MSSVLVVRLDADVKAQLEKHAQRAERTMSSLVRFLIMRELERRETEERKLEPPAA